LRVSDTTKLNRSMSNALQRTVRLRAAHEANQTAIMLRMTSSHDSRARWALRSPVTPDVPPSTLTLDWRRVAVMQVPNMTAALYRSAGVSSESSSIVGCYADEDETFICWNKCCSV
jgi:hypothetical protein